MQAPLLSFTQPGIVTAPLPDGRSRSAALMHRHRGTSVY